MRSNTLALFVLIGVLFGSVFLLAEPESDEIEQLKQQIRELQDKVDRLEEALRALTFSGTPVDGLPRGSRLQGEINGMKFYLVPVGEVLAE